MYDEAKMQIKMVRGDLGVFFCENGVAPDINSYSFPFFCSDGFIDAEHPNEVT